MGNNLHDTAQDAQINADPQPLALKDFMRILNAGRRQSSLYGSDHPSTQQAIEDLMQTVKAFLDCFGPSTFVLTEEAVILNDNWYKSSGESRELFQRLRSRGAMAFSLVGEPTLDQVTEFLTYLNTEPREVRKQGGSNSYLRKNGVTRIVATDTIYVSGDEEPGSTDQSAEAPSVDRAIAAVVAWLSKQDDEEVETPRFRTTEILSNPDTAARLIREAVTKLHSSSKKKRQSELATDVVNDLKDLASTNHQDWDKTTPSIRKAISKLPREMRPSLGGFGACDQDVEIDESPHANCASANAAEVEAQVNELLETAIGTNSTGLQTALPAIEKLFGAVSSGLLSNWKSELQPNTAVRSSGWTLAMLIAWETNSSEHGHIARSLAALIPRAIGMGEMQLALDAADCLAEEVNRPDQLPWRSINSRTALQTIEVSALKGLVEYALQSNDQRSQSTALLLVEVLPQLAMAMVETTINCTNEQFMDSLRAGIEKAGRTAAPVLGQLLRDGSPSTRWDALQLLAALRTDWALLEVESGLIQADPVFLARALDVILQVQSPITSRICTENLKHKSPTVRCAAVRSLGFIGDESALPYLVQCAARRAYRSYHVDEQVAAVQALGKLGGNDMIKFLDNIAISRSLFWRSKYEHVRSAAAEAANEIRSRQCTNQRRAA